MATTSTTALPVEDPYRLTVGNVKEPPRGWLQSLRYLGPGGRRLFNTLLVISSVAIALLGVFTVTSVFGLEVS